MVERIGKNSEERQRRNSYSAAETSIIRYSPRRAAMMHSNESEELLHGAFEELEKERTKRIVLEAKLKALQENSSNWNSKKAHQNKRRSSKTANSSTNEQGGAELSSRDHAALQQELVGYRQLVDAMTREKPAIAAAIRADQERRKAVLAGISTGTAPHHHGTNPTLPLHVVRLLEIMPWDPKAQEHAFAAEEMYEWQIYSSKQQDWVSTLKEFPSFFQALPTLEKSNNVVQESRPEHSIRQPGRDRSLLMFLAGCENMVSHGNIGACTSPHDGVFTNERLTYLMDLRDGFPLAHDGGTWKWVGSWQVQKRPTIVNNNQQIDDADHPVYQTLECDQNGWSYAEDSSHFFQINAADLCHENPGEKCDQVTVGQVSFLSGQRVVQHVMPLRKFRRRKWTRRRVLVEYPYASEQSLAFLQLLAQNASLTAAANNISDQLVETKMKVTQAQLDTQLNEEQAMKQVTKLKQELQGKEEMIAKLKKVKIVNDNDSRNTPKKQEKSGYLKHHNVSSSKDINDSNNERGVDGKYPKTELLQQGKDLQSLLSHWVVSSTSKLKIMPDYGAGDDSSDTPVPEDSSATSSTEVAEEDEGDEEITVKRIETSSDGGSTGNTNHDVDSNNDENRNSPKGFDWKKLGRDTLEKFKEGQAKASHAKLPWLSPPEKDQNQHQESSRAHTDQNNTSESHTEKEKLLASSGTEAVKALA